MDKLIFIWWWLFALLPVPWLLRWLLPAASTPADDALRVPFFQQISIGGGEFNPRPHGLVWRGVWLSLIWGLLVTAAARPTQIGEPLAMPVKGRDVMLAIDLSGSMAVRDLRRGRLTRLDVVKASADAFIARREGDRLGLIFFSDRAYLQSPLTFDHKVVRELLTEAEVGLTGKNTAIGDAIAIGLKRLKERPQPVEGGDRAPSDTAHHSDNILNARPSDGQLGDSRVLILLTDGENTAGVIKPQQAAAIAQQLGIKIYTIGIGNRNGKDSEGSEIDETLLKAIAKRTGGRYFRATDAKTLDEIYQQIDELEPMVSDALHGRPRRALYHYPAGLALLLAALYALANALVHYRLRGR